MKERAESYDLDGVVIDRRPLVGQFGAARDFVFKGAAIYEPPTIPLVPRFVNENGVSSPKEAVILFFHSIRALKKGVREFIESSDADKYANTGRSNKRPWVNMTRKTLSNGGVLEQFEDIYFKPKGFRTIESKGAAIADLRERYARVRHYDDNPADVLGLARVFPDVEFVIVQDLSTGILLSRTELSQYPNVSRVAALNGRLK
jgi:hypothetical protein